MIKIDSIKCPLICLVIFLFVLDIYNTTNIVTPIRKIEQTLDTHTKKLDKLLAVSFSPKAAKEINQLYLENIRVNNIR